MDRLDLLKRALLGEWQVRKTWAQKTAFIAWAQDYARELGVPLTVEESGRLQRSRNLVFGDAERASTLITAHYDTCAQLPFPNLLTPQCWPLIVLTQGLPALLLCALGVVLGAGMGRLMAGSPLSASMLATIAMTAICAALVALMLYGPANPHTANDNTSGVITALLALDALRGREDVAVVLFDNEEKGMLGSGAFIRRHPQEAKGAFVVNLDCVSDGRTLLYTGSKAGMRGAPAASVLSSLRACAQEKGYRVVSGEFPKTLYPSDQMVFAKGTAISALQGEKVLYLGRIHTARDTVFDDENVRCIVDALTRGCAREEAQPDLRADA